MNSVSTRRAWIVLGLVAAVLSLCGIRLFQLQVIEGPTLAVEGQAVRTQASTIQARRGQILDANGVVLADSVQTYHIAVNQVNLRSWKHVDDSQSGAGRVVGRGPAEAARLLAPLLGMGEAELGGLMTGDSTYVYLKKNVDAVTYRKIRELNIYGIEWESVFERVYPNGNTASSILGMTNAEGTGAGGLEAAYDEVLQGRPGQAALEIAPNGAVIPGGKSVTVDPVDGGTLRLTLNADLQHQMQESADGCQKQYSADWCALVMEEVTTGRILVMANSGMEDVDRSKVQPVIPVQYPFEPGSIGKIITMATALEQGTTTPTTAYSVDGTISPPGADGTIKDAWSHGVMQLTSAGIIAWSSNVGTVMIGEKLKDEDRYEMMQRFGFGKVTGLPLPGESEGIIRTPDQWQGRDHYTTMFGQSYAVTVAQLAQFAQTIGNGGVRLAPRLVDSWTEADGTVHTPEEVAPVEVIKPQLAADLLKMMTGVVEAEKAPTHYVHLEGYHVALKTGTAEMFGNNGGIVATSAGVFPAEQPRIAVATVVFRPRTGFAGNAGAEWFKEVVARSVTSLAIPATSTPPDLFPLEPGK